MLSRVTAKNVGDVFFETHCIIANVSGKRCFLPICNLFHYWQISL